MNFSALLNTYENYKETSLKNRYITYEMIKDLSSKFTGFSISVVGRSVLQKDIISYRIGSGKTKILMWSQMHGNESTATKALFDVFHFLQSSRPEAELFRSAATFVFLPMLNPDGAAAYTRLNYNNVDLNRDAVALSQPESKVLRSVFESFQPDFCFNLHGQRTIFSAGASSKSASLSFLSPSQDENKTVTQSRKKGMGIISHINEVLQDYIPNQVGRYDDGFNINCVGDTFQSEGVTTLLYEAGHIHQDYSREAIRKYFYLSLLVGMYSACFDSNLEENHTAYFEIPENQKLFNDVLLKQVTLDGEVVAIGLHFEEVLEDHRVVFKPKIAYVSPKASTFGHLELDCSQKTFNKELSASIIAGNLVKYLTFDNQNLIKALKSTLKL